MSEQYYKSSAMDKTVDLAVGQMLVERWTGTAFLVYYVLNGITLLLISGVMYQGSVYGKRMAIFGLIAGVFMIIPSNTGIVGMVCSLLTLIPWIIFTSMAAARFFKLSKPNTADFLFENMT